MFKFSSVPITGNDCAVKSLGNTIDSFTETAHVTTPSLPTLNHANGVLPIAGDACPKPHN